MFQCVLIILGLHHICSRRMRTRYAYIALIALISLSVSIQLVNAESDTGNPALPVYSQIKEAAEARQNELLYLLDQDLSPEVMGTLQAALYQMQLAEAAEDPQSAMAHYLDALKLFRETLSRYLKENKESPTNTLMPVTETETPPSPDEEELEEQIKENKERLLMKFQKRIEEKYLAYYDEITEIMEYLPEDDSKKIENTFQNALDKLKKIQEKAEEGDLDEAITMLNLDLDAFEEDLDYLEDENASKAIKKIVNTEDKAEKIKIEKEHKEKKGMDTSEEEESIKELRQEIKEAKEEYKNNKKAEHENHSNNNNGKSNKKDK